MIDVTHNVKTPGAITHALCRVQARASWVEEATANARLIAAAPEMAEALECLAAMAAHFPTVKTYGNRPRSGAIYSVSDMHLGEAAITVEDLHRAAALLSRIRGDVA
jgi:hypothetical protein